MDSDPAAEADRWIESEMRAADDLARFSESVAQTLFTHDIKTYIHSEKMLNRYDPNIDVAARVYRHQLQKDRQLGAIAGIAGNVSMLLLDGGMPEDIVEDIRSILTGILTSERNRRMIRTEPDDEIDNGSPIVDVVLNDKPF